MPFTLVSDFTGSDENPLSEGGNWATVNSSGAPLQRVGNAATGTGASDAYSYWTPANYGPDLEAYITRTTVSSGCGILFRVQGEGGAGTWDGYALRGTGSTAQVQRILNGVGTTLITSQVVAWANGDKFGARAVGNLLQIWRQPSGSSDWTLVTQTSDATYPSAGKIGLRVFATTETIDDFYVSDPLEYLFGGGVLQVPAVPFM